MSDTAPLTIATKPMLAGYRQLSPQEIALCNQIRELGNEWDTLIESLALDKSVDPRWLAIGKTDLQRGVMALVRAVTQPEFF